MPARCSMQWTTCTAPGHCCSHWLYRSSWINRLRSWPVQLCSLVSMMRWWPVHLVVRLLSHSASIWCLDNIGRPSTKNQSECIYLGQYRSKSIFRTVYMYVKLFHEISNFELHVVQLGKLRQKRTNLMPCKTICMQSKIIRSNRVDSPFLQAMAPKVFQNSQWLPLVAEQEDCQWNKLERHLQPFCSLKETLMDSRNKPSCKTSGTM